MGFWSDVGDFRATTKVTSFKIVQEKDDALFVVRKMVESLNDLVAGVLPPSSFNFGVENIQNQNSGTGEMDVVAIEATLDGFDIFVCLAKNLSVRQVGISVYVLYHIFEYAEVMRLGLTKRTSLSL